jgi:acetoin utilization deacetylase AcuC-like enzyme
VPPGSGGAEFLELIENRVAAAILDYDPDLVIISAGYDAHRDDPLAQCMLEDSSYGELASAVRGAAERAGAPILVCLEGGYELRALAASVRATIAALG